jgi:hypothetical protein
MAAALWLSRGPYGWLASAVAVVLSLPRFFVYDVTYLAVGARRARSLGRDDMTIHRGTADH